MDRPTPIVELGVDEAYALLRDQFGRADLPPLEAIENEDWGRDYLLSRLAELDPGDLAAAGLCRDEPAGAEEADQPPGAAPS